MNEQLIFKFPYKKIFLKEDFYVSKSNFEAFKLIESWPKWLKKSVNISGPKGSGKSHLASILKRKSSSLIINSKDINDGVFFNETASIYYLNSNLDNISKTEFDDNSDNFFSKAVSLYLDDN